VANETRSKSESYAPIGYGRPPAATQFKKGQSGNTPGRPPKAKS
jgi:hypothetical protein